ncbi:hypothetical protein [Shinella zoogloeoides]|uniref:hypothetical protein n=1 Tax=Shinella zoogloeoides TaxID=352475 RepID=UPI0028AD1972|nr:hypothetical protein [Shinella zoogloeoides]
MKQNYKEDIIEWIIDIFDKKSKSGKYGTKLGGTTSENPLLYSITVQIPPPSRSLHTVNAQQRFFEAFSAYYSNTLRKQCASVENLRSRHKRDQPLIFLAFDMEGSRSGYKSSQVQCPHGHGLILFTERQIQNFLKHSGAVRNADGRITLLKPARGIIAITFDPLPTPFDAQSFADYAVKHISKLTSIQENDTPFEWYPCPSKHYPFWKEYANDYTEPSTFERLRSDRTADRPIDPGRRGRQSFERSGPNPT